MDYFIHYTAVAFAVLFILLGSVDISLDMTISSILDVALISIGSFFEFGYFRIYEAFLHKYPDSFFTDEDSIRREISVRSDFWAHFIPGILYVAISTLMVIIAIYL